MSKTMSFCACSISYVLQLMLLSLSFSFPLMYLLDSNHRTISSFLYFFIFPDFLSFSLCKCIELQLVFYGCLLWKRILLPCCICGMLCNCSSNALFWLIYVSLLHGKLKKNSRISNVMSTISQ